MKTVLVTGGATGIGRAICHMFAKEGYRVIISYNKSEEAAKALSDELSAVRIKADIRYHEDVYNMFSEAGGVDILVNNAGISSSKLFTDITVEEWDDMFSVHVRGTFLCCRAALPYMLHQKSGKIINISSIWGITGGSCEVHYSAAKAAVIGLTKALAKEVGPSGITVNCIAPGVIETDMMKSFSEDDKEALKKETPINRLGTPEDVALASLYLAKADFMTGQVISPNGGIVI